HSLLAMKLVAKLREKLGITLPLRTLFESPNPEALAQRLEANTEVDDHQLVPQSGRSANGAITLSHGQERLWALDRVDGPSATYNMTATIKMNGALDIPSLEKALVAIITRHESLRTVMNESVEGTAVGTLLPPPLAQHFIAVTDLSRLALNDPTACETQLDQLIQ
ncbi:hypothetical protein ICN41_11190, partial [Polynucleobacter sp. 15G-AUS-farblos]|uniref:condensation domain-containing protein n=1 Tax=Polynucleobacter sp. 15G-AUS-farblos TaxID=2689094 RepID=UPI001C0B11A2